MPVYKVIVGNVGSVYQGTSRTKTLSTHKSYVEISKEHVEARCYGEDVTLLVDGEIEQEHAGHLRLEEPMLKSKDRLRSADTSDEITTSSRIGRTTHRDHYQPKRA